nr:glycosyltransferase family 4 protein [uncultured Marinifilum sp.]
MKVVVLGTRGIPKIQGGVETHCEKLYPRLANLGCDVTLIRRKGYVASDNQIEDYEGVHLVDVFSPKQKSIEAIFHSLVGVVKAKRLNPDVLHIHAIGPSLVVPFAKMLGMKVVTTHHGPDYDRQKWNRVAKRLLRVGESMGAHFSDRVIVISEVIKELLDKKYHCKEKLDLIYNGVDLPEKSKQTDYIESLGVEAQKYIIAVGRFVEEKGFHDLIAAYKNITTDMKLVLVGDADHESIYSEQLKAMAKDAGVVLTGFIKGEKLNQVFSHAGLFVLPSYHEGLPIALLEAMSYNLNVLVSDIPANAEVKLDANDYFKVGDVENLSEQLNRKVKNHEQRDFVPVVKKKYNWDEIAKQVLAVYDKMMRQKRKAFWSVKKN